MDENVQIKRSKIKEKNISLERRNLWRQDLALLETHLENRILTKIDIKIEEQFEGMFKKFKRCLKIYILKILGL